VDNALEAAISLHQHMMRAHWNGQAVAGPDPIGKINWRLSRFVRSYLSPIPWRDQYVFLQGQGYWIRDNLRLKALTGEGVYGDIARQAADHVVQIQRSDGGWNYGGFQERRHLISIVEGCWAGLGLLDAYRQLGKNAYLESAVQWYSFHRDSMGFQVHEDGLAPNFYDRPGAKVSNAATLLLRFVAELSEVTDSQSYLENADRIVRFLQYAQMPNGEFEYTSQLRPHFMCYQYNAYEFLDLARFYELSGDVRALEMLSLLAEYLATGVTQRGSCRYDCFKEDPEVDYWTAALAAALHRAHELNLSDYAMLSNRAFHYLLGRQKPNGAFIFSQRNYGLLQDTRSYPRCLAMILDHLLHVAEAEKQAVPPPVQIPQQDKLVV
jgi:hypothetical protein